MTKLRGFQVHSKVFEKCFLQSRLNCIRLKRGGKKGGGGGLTRLKNMLKIDDFSVWLYQFWFFKSFCSLWWLNFSLFWSNFKILILIISFFFFIEKNNYSLKFWDKIKIKTTYLKNFDYSWKKLKMYLRRYFIQKNVNILLNNFIEPKMFVIFEIKIDCKEIFTQLKNASEQVKFFIPKTFFRFTKW